MGKLVRAKRLRAKAKAYASPQLTTYGSVMHLTAAGSGNRSEDQGGQTICNSGGDFQKIRC